MVEWDPGALALARGRPLVGLFLTTGAVFWINVATVAALLLVYLLLVYLRLLCMTRWSAQCLWWWPVAPILMIGIATRGALLTLWRGSVGWHCTWYPLQALRQEARRPARDVAVH